MLGEFQKKSSRWKASKIIYSWPVFLIVLLVVGFLLFSTAKTYLIARQTIKELESLQGDVIDIKEHKDILENRIAEFESQSGLEKEIRKRFYAKKPGEELLVIVERDSAGEGDNLKNESFFSAGFKKIKDFLGL